MADILHRVAWNISSRIVREINRISFPRQKYEKTVLRFNTAINTDNLGDEIIMHYCELVLRDMFPEADYYDVPTHSIPTREQEEKVDSFKYKFVCGTNLLTSTIEEHWNWILPDGIRRKLHFRNVILLGVGWKNYEKGCSEYSKAIYRCMLNPNLVHSVRDSHTEKMLKDAGIKNVINTGCPTMWKLTPEFCSNIPKEKAKYVITTVTDYRPDIEADSLMLKILSECYEKVFLWIQGSTDEKYISNLELPRNLEIVPASIEAYEKILNTPDLDYIGTRLHAGIFALNHSIRSLIIGVDNRAMEIAKDTNLLVINRNNIADQLVKYIYQNRPTEIRLKQENIDLFKSQFGCE